MKKIIKFLSVALCLFTMSFAFCACDDDTDEKILVKELTLSQTEIVLYTSTNQSSTEDIEVSFKPENATSLDVQFFSYDENLIQITKKENSDFTFTVSAINFDADNAQTTIGVRMKGNTKVQTHCDVKIKKINEKLASPTNVRFDNENKKLVWDKSASENLEDFNGYEVELLEEGQTESRKIVCPTTNSLSLNTVGKKITARVKTLSQLKVFDSDYSENYTFKILNDVKNLKNNSGVISWDAVEGASGYKYIKNEEPAKDIAKENTAYNETFETAGKYSISVQAVAEDELNQNNDIVCHIFAGKPDTIYITKFETPVLEFNSYFSWNSILTMDGLIPESYELAKLINGEYQVVQNNKLLSYLQPENLETGSHTYRLRAVGNGNETLSSEFSFKTVQKIETISNLRVEDGIITWDRIPNAVGYDLTISGATTQTIRISDPEQTQYVLGNSYSGEYNVKIVFVGNSADTFASDSSNQITVTKLSAPEKASFTLTNNVVEWAEQTGAKKYKIVLQIGDETINKTVSQNQYTLDEVLEAGNISIKVCALGSTSSVDSDYFLNGEYSQVVYAQKLSTPTVEIVNGEVVWNKNKPANATGFVLNINNGTDLDKDFNMGMITKFDFYELNSQIFDNITHFDAGNYYVKVKALGGNASGYIGTFDSDYSLELQVTKHETPVVKLIEGQIERTASDGASNFVRVEPYTLDGKQMYCYYSAGDSERYVRSDLSNVVVVSSRTNNVNFHMENGILYWDEIGSEYFGATYEMKLNGEVLADISTQTSKDFNYLEAGEYTVIIKVIGTTSGINDNLVLTNSQVDSFNFTKLESPEVSIMTAASAIESQTLDENKLPGTIIWKEVENALGYKILVKNGNTSVEKDVYVNYFALTDFDAGTYTVSIKAYGNNENVVSSDLSEEKQVVKLIAPTNVSISNDGKISWNTESSYISGLVNARVIFVLIINGEYYTFYDFEALASSMASISMSTISDLAVLKNTCCYFDKLYSINNLSKKVEFLEGTYNISVVAIPLNYKESLGVASMLASCSDNDAMSNESTKIQFTKLEQPYGLRVDQNEDGDYIASWTNHFDTNISQYQIAIQEKNEDIPVLQTIPASQTTFNLTEYLKDKSVSDYYIAVRALTETDGYIYSSFGDSLLVKMLSDLNISIQDGKLNWSKIDGAKKYILCFDNLTTSEKFDLEFAPDTTELSMSLFDDERFVAGEYNLKAKVIGNESSENLSAFYMDTFAEKDYGTIKKLATPTNLKVQKGVINYECLDTPSNFNLYFVGTKIETIDNGVNTTYELDEKFNAGSYGLTIQAMGNNIFINSEISASITPEIVIKLSAPTARVENGKLKWTSVDNANGYLIKISGARFYVYDSENSKYIEDTSSQHFEFSVLSVDSIDLSKELTSTDGTKFNLTNGEYSVQVKALGSDYTYLNSNYSTKGTVKKLKDITGVQVKQGKLSWDKVLSGDALNGINLYVKFDSMTSYEEPIKLTDMSENSYSFDNEKYSGKKFTVYMQIIGDENKIISGSSASINGSSCEEIEIEKLSTPTNAIITSTTEQDCFGRYTFDACVKTGVTYEIKINITTGANSKEFVQVVNQNYFDLKSSNFAGINIEENTKIQICVRYLGNNEYINSDYSDVMTIIVPQTPTLQLVFDEQARFTGKVTWNKVSAGNLDAGYIIYVQFISQKDAIANSITDTSDVTEGIWDLFGQNFEPYTTNENRYYVFGKGYYRFSITAVLNIDGTENQIMSNESPVSQTVLYRIFETGLGEENNPFVIDSVDSFNAIRYNLTAYYKLANNISFAGKTVYPIGSEDEMFTGSFDGKGYTLSDITLSSVLTSNAIFNYIGENGTIKNVNIKNISITNGAYIGGIAGVNYGTIENITVGSSDSANLINPSSTISLKTMAGGIVGVNYGTIISCTNYSTVSAKNDNAEVYSGGIAGTNYGKILNSTNYGNIGGTGITNDLISSNMSGGIIGYNEKLDTTDNLVQNCYNYGNVYAISRNSKGVSQSAYAGGIVAYNNAGTINKCFNDNSNGVYTKAGLSAKTQIFVMTMISQKDIYAGGLVGYNGTGSKITECYTLSNINYDKNGTSATENIGAIVGKNLVKSSSSFNTIYYFTFNSSITSDAGSVMPTIKQDIIGYKQSDSNSLENFKLSIHNKFGIDLA